MRTHEEPLLDRMKEWLLKAGLDSEKAALAEQYLEDGQHPELYEQMMEWEIKDLSGLPQEVLQESRKLFGRLKEHPVNDYGSKFINILYAMGGATAKYAMVDGYNTYTLRDGLLKNFNIMPEVTANLMCEVLAFENNYNFDWQHFKTWISKYGVTMELAAKAMDRVNPNFSNGAIMMMTAYFYHLSKGQGVSLTDKEKEYIKDLEEDCLLGFDCLYGITTTEYDKKLLDSFLRENEDTTIVLRADIHKMLRKGHMDEYIAKLMVGTAFTNMKYSNYFKNYVYLALAVNPAMALSGMYNMSAKDYFESYALKLDKIFYIPREAYIRWTAENNKTDSILKVMGRESREIYLNVLKKEDYATANRMMGLLDQLSKNPEEIEQLKKDMRGKIADNVLKRADTGQSKCKEYFTGGCTLAELLKAEPQLETSFSTYYWADGNMIESYVKGSGKDDFYGRLMVYLALRGVVYYFEQIVRPRGVFNANEMEELFQILEDQGLSLYHRLHLYEGIFDNCYSDSGKNEIKNHMVIMLQRIIAEHREEVMESLKKLAPTGRITVLTALLAAGEENEPVLLDAFLDSSKQVKEMLAETFAGRDQSEQAVIGKLSSKKAAERETALQILKRRTQKLGLSDSLKQVLETALAAEKSAKLASLMNSMLGITVSEEENQTAGAATSSDYAAELLKGGRKRSLAWLYETSMPEVHKKNGEAAAEEFMQAVLLSYSTMESLGVNAKARLLTDELNARELEVFACAVFDKWLEKGAEAKKKWVLYFSSINGGSDMVQVLKKWVGEWPQISRGAIAVEAVKALALNGTPTALMIVDGISRKFKFRQIKEAATAALAAAAGELGITTEELADKIVPNLGFDQNGERSFDYGTKSFRVLLTPALELEIFDDKDKKVKNLPAPPKKAEDAPADENTEKAKAAYEEFKELKKLLKTTVATQKMRLELALSAERRWTKEAWEALFVRNPVMHQFAIGLIWGSYQEGMLKDTFRYMEEGTFNTPEEDELELSEDSLVGLVHPLELTGELLAAWKEQLSDYEIVQPIEQLERKVYLVEDQEIGKKELERFGGVIINSLSLTGKLTGAGWYRGSVQDAGGYYTFFKEDKAQNIGAELEFSGAYVGGDSEDVTIYEVRFYKAGTVSHGSYVYDTIKPEHAYELEAVPKKFFSETVYQLTKAFASSTGKNPDWKLKKNY